MGVTKSEIHKDEYNKLANLFKVLGHPARIAILQHIIDEKTCICNDLVEELGLAQATISQHLKELKKMDILQGSIEGKSICYCINEEKWKEVKKEIGEFLDQDIKKKQCC